ncbi:MAG: GyrI-like domain-containing protein [Calditrichaeota bacterium]|nr:GyrI-like domain-containing protein [Calditrichota bacterium]
MKYEWRKKEKAFYLPKAKPELLIVPNFQFLTINGAGNPNDPFFADYITVLYALSYAIKMNLKKAPVLDAYQDYTVYPLEGVWDITEEARKNFTGTINKDDLVFKLMIRQPDFVTADYVRQITELTRQKKPLPLLDQVRFEPIRDGQCVQMLHTGSYDNENASFEQMETFAESIGLKRVAKIHREIYLSDFRKVPAAKLKTVLRFKVEE